jgi:hypothetical protein
MPRSGPGCQAAPVRRTLIALAIAFLVAACGNPDYRVHDEAVEAAREEATSWEGAEFVGIEGVAAATDTDLTLLTDPLPVESNARRGCAVEVAPRVEEHETQILVYIDYRGAARSPFEGCEVAPRTLTVPLAAPVGERAVHDAMGARFWLRDGAWVGCGSVVMTCITEPAACDNLRDFIANMDVPRHFGMDTISCDGQTAVVDVDYGAGDCPVTGEPQHNPCAGQRVRRLTLVVDDDAWVVAHAEER